MIQILKTVTKTTSHPRIFAKTNLECHERGHFASSTTGSEVVVSHNMIRRPAVLLIMLWLKSVAPSTRLAFVRLQSRHQSRASVSVLSASHRRPDPLSKLTSRANNAAARHSYLAIAREYPSSLIRRFSSTTAESQEGLFAQDVDFETLGVQSKVLLRRLQNMGFERPTAVQKAAYERIRVSQQNVTIGAETGSGKVSMGYEPNHVDR